MKIGVFGSGVVGQTLAAKLAGLGQDVMVGTRNAAETRARSEPDPYGRPSFRDWLAQNPGVGVGTFAEAARRSEMLFNAVSGYGTLPALEQAGAPNLAGKILVDISNPLDFSAGMPPTLSVCNTDSLGEQIQRAYPDLRVVKALNTVTAALMVNPRLVADGEHTLFICGEDAEAKTTVVERLKAWFGWKEVIDLGGISAARGTEMYLPIWLRLWGALGTGMFNVRVVR